MDSDEESTIPDPEEAAWASAQRRIFVEYLTALKVDHGGISLEPRWFLMPYVAIWAIRSKKNPDRIGWWGISGDLPTDYVTCTNERSDADVLMTFSRTWKKAAEQMSQGIAPENYQIGPPGRERELAPMLLSRAEALEDLARDFADG